MRSDMTVIFDERRTVDVSVDIEPSPGHAAQAREWFNSAWEALGCEPLRPSGKVLLLDKIMGVADALGYEVLKENHAKAREFATQAAYALERTRITVDLPGLTVGY